jgi:GTP-binding protein lepA
MKFRTLKPMIYGGVSYEVDAEVDIQEKSVIKSCLERGLIAEINGKTEKSEELIGTENTEETDKKDTKNKKK